MEARERLDAGALLTPRQVAAFLGVHEVSLARWRMRGGTGPAWVRLGSRAVRYKTEDVLHFAAAQERSAA